ncbi:MAG TPA: amidohydrolase family protein [Chloroflexota bacterium]|nr:amidohydrolase family protein [Chloroflexota bacterium]
MRQVLRGATLIDGTGAAPRPATVVVDGARIAAVLDGAPATLPAEFSGNGQGEAPVVYDAAGLTLLPGLIDAHDHLSHIGLDVYQRLATSPSLACFELANTLRVTLEGGFTAIRDASGTPAGAKQAVARGLVPGPRLMVSVIMITPSAGHGDRTHPCGLPGHFPVLPDVPEGLADGPDEIRKKVRELVRLGADWIKFCATGGISSAVGGPLGRQYTREEIGALVDEAHKLERPVMVHAYGGQGLRDALEAGVDTVEHGAYLWQDEDALRQMADRGVYLVPTLVNSRKYVERAARNPGATPEYIRRKAPEVIEFGARTMQRALELGVPVAMGTDAGMFGHGDNAAEIVTMVEAGMTPMQALVATTASAARCIGLGDQVGTIEPGKLADLILVAGDPLRDITILRDRANLRLVMKDGTPHVNRLAAPAPVAV